MRDLIGTVTEHCFKTKTRLINNSNFVESPRFEDKVVKFQRVLLTELDYHQLQEAQTLSVRDESRNADETQI